MNLRHLLAGVGLVAAAALAGPAAVAHAATTPPAPVCKTASVTLGDEVSREDSGTHGTWAKDKIVRKVEICQTGKAPATLEAETAGGHRVVYTATVKDAGEFITVAGKSPGKGVALAAGIKGNLTGQYTDTFTAEPGFKNYKPAIDGKAFKGAAPSSSTDFVKTLWGGSDFHAGESMLGWTWTYWTCVPDVKKAPESWTNSNTVNEGDITGKVACPTVTPTSAPTAAPIVLPSASTSTPAASLPVTGTNNTVPLVATALGLLAVGGVTVFAVRRRRTA